MYLHALKYIVILRGVDREGESTGETPGRSSAQGEGAMDGGRGARKRPTGSSEQGGWSSVKGDREQYALTFPLASPLLTNITL